MGSDRKEKLKAGSCAMGGGLEMGASLSAGGRVAKMQRFECTLVVAWD